MRKKEKKWERGNKTRKPYSVRRFAVPTMVGTGF